MVGALYDGGNSFEVEVGLRRESGESGGSCLSRGCGVEVLRFSGSGFLVAEDGEELMAMLLEWKSEMEAWYILVDVAGTEVVAATGWGGCLGTVGEFGSQTCVVSGKSVRGDSYIGARAAAVRKGRLTSSQIFALLIFPTPLFAFAQFSYNLINFRTSNQLFSQFRPKICAPIP